VIQLVATWYVAASGAPLYCSTPDAPLAYDIGAAPWVALPVREYGDAWQCGDLIYLSWLDGNALMARAYDAGPFGAHCVETGGACLPIAVDVPRHLWPVDGLSAPVRVVNVTAEVRGRGE